MRRELQSLHALPESLRIEGRLHLRVIVEVDEDIAAIQARRIRRARPFSIVHFASTPPGVDALSPSVELFLAVSTCIKLFTSVQAAINKVRCDIHEQRPFHCVRHDKTDLLPAQKRDELFAGKALMAYLHGVPYRKIFIDTCPVSAVETLIMLARKFCGLPLGARKHIDELSQNLRVKPEVWWELPKDRPQFRAELQNTLREEVCQRRLNIAQLLHVRDEARSLDCELKIIRRLRRPFGKALRLLQRVERTVELNCWEGVRGKLKLTSLSELLRIKDAAPTFVSPT